MQVQTSCHSCGAPLTNKRNCDYCGTAVPKIQQMKGSSTAPADDSYLKERIREIENKYVELLTSRFTIFKNIPPDKLENAQESYAPKLYSDETVIAFHDSSFNGSAKSGFILTTKRLYFRNASARSNVVKIESIDKVTFTGKGFWGIPAALLHLNSGGEARVNVSAGMEVHNEALVNVLNDMVAFLKEYH